MIDPATGYDPDDQFFYSRRLVAELLPLALAGPEPPVRGPTDGPGAQGDPAEGGNTLVMILDVRRVLDRMSGLTKLAAVDAIISGREIPAYVLDEVVDLLGGPAPWKA